VAIAGQGAPRHRRTIQAEPAVYADEFADEVRDRLLASDGVLVSVDPMHEGKTRSQLDPIDAASLPIIWDADFLWRPRTAFGPDS
jgi:hypothetical protein